MLKSGTLGTAGTLGTGHFLTFKMDWGPNFGWNTFLKFENPSTSSKVRHFQSFRSKNLDFYPKNTSVGQKTQFFASKFLFLAQKRLELSNF